MSEIKDQLQEVKQRRVQVIKDYHDAITRAVEKGWTNAEIAQAMGVGEATIRMYVKRHQIEHKCG